MADAPVLPLLTRLPPGVWLAASWSAIILVRTLQRPGELPSLLEYGGNVEDAPLLVTAVVTTLAALLLSRAPLAAVTVVLGGALFSMGMRVQATSVVLFLLADGIVAHTAAACTRRTSLLAASLPNAAMAGYAIWRAVCGYPVAVSPWLALAAISAVAWLIGNTVRQSRAHADALRSSALHQAVIAERLRIARELHDIVAHDIGAIAIQAGVGSRVMDTQPDQTRNALEAIETTSRETLAGLRRVLGVLRQTDPVPAPADHAAGLADLARLVAKAGDAGVRVDVRWRGERRSLPADVDLTAFRVIQEALTNVVRHSGATECGVTVDRRSDALVVEVVDRGRGGSTTGGGYGIVGMRERVGLLHGRFSAGPRPGGGFRVAVRLPLAVAAAK